MGFDISSSHHEAAPAQHEIDFGAEDAERTADMIMTFRMAVKTIAKKHGLYATFLPKPVEGISGSGMHINIIAEDENGNNLFAEGSGPDISETAQHFIAGVLSHIKGMTLITNPLVNSYKRLVPGYDAPVTVSWSSSSNRSALIRIPSGRGQDTRIELRNPDAATNPYLSIALILAAGIEGIEKKLQAPPQLTENLGKATYEQLRNSSFETLPMTLGEAINACEEDPFVRQVLGDAVYTKFLDAKRSEWKDFRTCVTQWEIKRYLSKF